VTTGTGAFSVPSGLRYTMVKLDPEGTTNCSLPSSVLISGLCARATVRACVSALRTGNARTPAEPQLEFPAPPAPAAHPTAHKQPSVPAITKYNPKFSAQVPEVAKSSPRSAESTNSSLAISTTIVEHEAMRSVMVGDFVSIPAMDASQPVFARDMPPGVCVCVCLSVCLSVVCRPRHKTRSPNPSSLMHCISLHPGK
jgi:hypothetical protein